MWVKCLVLATIDRIVPEYMLGFVLQEVNKIRIGKSINSITISLIKLIIPNI